MSGRVVKSEKRRILEERIKSNQEELQRILRNQNQYDRIHSLKKAKLQTEINLKYYNRNRFTSCMYNVPFNLFLFVSIKAPTFTAFLINLA